MMTKITSISCLLCTLLLAFPASQLSAEGWGHLKLRLVYDGVVPKREPVTLTKDAAYCGKFKLVDDSLIVNPENKGIANVVVYVRTKDVAIHPDYEAQIKKPVLMDNKGCRFEPRMTILWTEQTIHLKNSDTVGHNTALSMFFNDSINPLIPSGGTYKGQFKNEERLPAKATCGIHRWMTGWVVIRSNPYSTAADKNGLVELKNLPAGELEFQVWQEKAGYISKVTLDGTATEWIRGRAKFVIEAGKTTDVGDVLVNTALFNK
jgi:hypothetical protein